MYIYIYTFIEIAELGACDDGGGENANCRKASKKQKATNGKTIPSWKGPFFFETYTQTNFPLGLLHFPLGFFLCTLFGRASIVDFITPGFPSYNSFGESCNAMHL